MPLDRLSTGLVREDCRTINKRVNRFNAERARMFTEVDARFSQMKSLSKDEVKYLVNRFIKQADLDTMGPYAKSEAKKLDSSGLSIVFNVHGMVSSVNSVYNENDLSYDELQSLKADEDVIEYRDTLSFGFFLVKLDRKRFTLFQGVLPLSVTFHALVRMVERKASTRSPATELVNFEDLLLLSLMAEVQITAARKIFHKHGHDRVVQPVLPHPKGVLVCQHAKHVFRKRPTPGDRWQPVTVRGTCLKRNIQSNKNRYRVSEVQPQIWNLEEQKEQFCMGWTNVKTFLHEDDLVSDRQWVAHELRQFAVRHRASLEDLCMTVVHPDYHKAGFTDRYEVMVNDMVQLMGSASWRRGWPREEE